MLSNENAIKKLKQISMRIGKSLEEIVVREKIKSEQIIATRLVNAHPFS